MVLSEEIVEIESMACSKFIVKQYSVPKIDGADAVSIKNQKKIHFIFHSVPQLMKKKTNKKMFLF